jgi:hypothetical protein
MRSTKAVAIVFLIYVTKSLASDGFAFHFIRVAGNVLLEIGYHDVALGGRQVSGHKGEKNPWLPPAFHRKASVPAADLGKFAADLIVRLEVVVYDLT